jgi:hypothetical protein
MNYEHIYEQLTSNKNERKKKQGIYYESHHIFPECMGGSNDKENKVLLLPEEHYVAHQLLIKIYPGNSKLIYAAKMMTCNAPNNNRSKNKLYGWLRCKFGESMKNRVFTDEHRKKISESLTGKKLSEDHKKAISDSKRGEKNPLYGKTHSDKTKELMSKKAIELLENSNHISNKTRGIARTEEVKRKIRESKRKDNYIVTCPHCGKEGKVAGMKTWHFNNCRNKNNEKF